MMGDLTPRAQQALALSKRIAVEMEANAVGIEAWIGIQVQVYNS